jgi:hypothetical protein
MPAKYFRPMKNRMNATRLVLFYSGCVAMFPVSCNSIFAKSKPGSDDGYESVTATGSMLPQRVKTGQGAASTAPVDTMSAERFDKMRQQIQPTSPGNGG